MKKRTTQSIRDENREIRSHNNIIRQNCKQIRALVHARKTTNFVLGEIMREGSLSPFFNGLMNEKV